MTFVDAENEYEAKSLAMAEYNTRQSNYFKIIDDSGTEVYSYSSLGNVTANDFSAYEMSNGHWIVDYMPMT